MRWRAWAGMRGGRLRKPVGRGVGLGRWGKDDTNAYSGALLKGEVE